MSPGLWVRELLIWLLVWLGSWANQQITHLFKWAWRDVREADKGPHGPQESHPVESSIYWTRAVEYTDRRVDQQVTGLSRLVQFSLHRITALSESFSSVQLQFRLHWVQVYSRPTSVLNIQFSSGFIICFLETLLN